jgi:porphobilinogen deaminase
VVLSVDGQEVVYAQMHVDMAQPAESGRALATVLLDQGAREILQAIRQPIPVDAP